MILTVLVYVSLKHGLIVVGRDFLTVIEKHVWMCTHASTITASALLCHAQQPGWENYSISPPPMVNLHLRPFTYSFYASIVM